MMKNLSFRHPKKIYFLFFLSLCCCLWTTVAQAQAWQTDSFPKREIRAVWLGTIGGIDWPRTKATNAASTTRQKEELRKLLNQLQEAGINVVVLQTRIRGTVIYPSRYEPWDDCLTGKYGRSPGYDPLQFAVEECHKRGMELHAWLVCIPLGSTKKQRAYGRESITMRRSNLCQKASSEWFMRPNQQATADYLGDLCAEIVEKYDVDGISLDYIRYPEAQYHFKDQCTAAQRRENISRIVQRIHERVRPLAAWVKLSSSPIGKYRDLRRYSSHGWNCYDAVYQDPQRWLREGWQDWMMPMMYFRGDQFYPFLFDWQENSARHPVAVGLGAYQLDPREGKLSLSEIRAQMHTARRSGIGGVAFYRAEYLVKNYQGIFSTVRDEFNPYPALTPAMNSENTPQAPSALFLQDNLLFWDDFQNGTDVGRDYTLYNIYGSDTWPVDINRAENLLITHVRSTSVELYGRALGKRYYAVTAMNRYGQESEPCQEAKRNDHPQGRP